MTKGEPVGTRDEGACKADDDGVYGEVRAERERAHALHGDTSMEAFHYDDLLRLAILTEEIGEVAKEFNEARHDARAVDPVRLRKELIQVAAMAVAWADVIDVPEWHYFDCGVAGGFPHTSDMCEGVRRGE